MLYTLGQLSAEFPEVSDLLAQGVQEASLRLPTKPPSRGASRAGQSRGLAGAGAGAGAGSGTPGSTVPQRTFDLEL